MPFSSVNAPERFADENEPSEAALPTEVTAPVKFALVVTLPAVSPEAVPDKVPLNVKLPVVVTVPDKESPLTVPVPLTEVTEPLPLLLKVVQSAALKAPRLDADAVGTCSVITGVVVPFATVLDRSVPVVPRVSAATLVTVPLPLLLNVVQSVLVR